MSDRLPRWARRSSQERWYVNGDDRSVRVPPSPSPVANPTTSLLAGNRADPPPAESAAALFIHPLEAILIDCAHLIAVREAVSLATAMHSSRATSPPGYRARPA